MGLWRNGTQLVLWANPAPTFYPPALAGNSDCCNDCQCYLVCYEKVLSTYTSTWTNEKVGDFCATTLRQQVPPQPAGILAVYADVLPCGGLSWYCANDLTWAFTAPPPPPRQAWQQGGEPCPFPTQEEMQEEGWEDAPRLFSQWYWRARLVESCEDCCTTLEEVVPGCWTGIYSETCGGADAQSVSGLAYWNCSQSMQLDVCYGTEQNVQNQPCPENPLP
jgi:hypothetical protein